LFEGTPAKKQKRPENKPVPNPVSEAALPDIPELTAEADAKIREALRLLANTPGRKTGPTIAPKLIKVYGEGLRAARKQRHGWQKLAKIFRAHGLHVGEKSLQTRLEKD
jgi:hypothetical protein